MMRKLRRLFWFGLLVAGGYRGYQTVVRRRAEPPATPAYGAASDLPSPAPVARMHDALRDAVPDQAATVAARWVAPVDGTCPVGYPVKGSKSSGIFHVPGGRFYERTIPERCYANAEDATAEGYRPAKA